MNQHLATPLKAEPRLSPRDRQPTGYSDVFDTNGTWLFDAPDKTAAAIVEMINAKGFAGFAAEGIIKMQADSIVELGAIIDGLLLLLDEHHKYSCVEKSFCPACAHDTRANEAGLAIQHLKAKAALAVGGGSDL